MVNKRDLLTTAEVAEIAGVGTTTIKRWVDQGVLSCVRTAGGHRRFLRSELGRIVSGVAAVGSPQVVASRWIELLSSNDVHRVAGALLDARGRTGAWHATAEELGSVLCAVGERWASGELSVAQEHQISEVLQRGVAQVLSHIPNPERAPLALLACPPDEEHTLGLLLAELCLREAGWRALWLGRTTPLDDLVAILEGGNVDMLVMSASPCRSGAALARVHERLAPVCIACTVPWVVGGAGPWPQNLAPGRRLHSFSEFHALAVALKRDDAH